MTSDAILWPVIVLVFWTIGVLGLVPFSRIRATLIGRTKVSDYRYGESVNVPGDVALANRAYMNLLELPVLFYVVVVILLATGRVDNLYVMLAWGFVAFRIAHTLVQLVYNNVLHRLGAFAGALAFLIAMWVRLAVSLG